MAFAIRLQIRPRLQGRQKLVQLFFDALHRHAVEVGGQLLRRRFGGLVDNKTEPGRKAVETQDAQSVFFKAAQRLAVELFQNTGQIADPVSICERQ